MTEATSPDLEALRSANEALRAGNDVLRAALRDAWRLLDGLDADANNLQLDVARMRRLYHVPLAGLNICPHGHDVTVTPCSWCGADDA